MTEDILRFLTVREPGIKNNKWRLEPFGRDDAATPLARRVAELSKKRSARADFTAVAQTFRNSDDYKNGLDNFSLDLPRLLDWTRANSRTAVIDLDLDQLADQLASGQTTGSIVSSSEFRNTFDQLHDSVLADSLDRRTSTETTDQYLAVLKVLILLRRHVENALEIDPQTTLSEWLARTVVVLSRMHRAHPEDSPVPPPPPPAPKPDGARLKALESARRFILRAMADPLAIEVPASTQKLAGDTRRSAAAARDKTQGAPRHLMISRTDEFEQERPRLSGPALRQLPADTRAVLQSLGLEDQIDPFRALPLIDQELVAAAAELPSDQPVRLLSLNGALIDLDAVRNSMGAAPPSYALSSNSGCQLTAGIGDLLIVRQNLKAYELADFAHVENVLAGEYREREHRRLDLSEESTTEESETTTDKERDLQSTERNEMQSEMERTVQSSFGLETGLQLSGSYGPTVSFSASLGVSYSTTSEESQRKAASFAREVSERVAERVQERVRKETRRRTLTQIEELNRHRVDNQNAANGHIRGIYRWLNKVYDAQVFNYGRRMMIEFVVPEPAAYFMYAMVQNPPNNPELVKPNPPMANGKMLQPGHLDFATAQALIAKYQVLDAPAYPAASMVVSHFDSLEGSGGVKDMARGAKIPIPAGYSTNVARVTGISAGDPDTFLIAIGGYKYFPIPELTKWIELKNTYSNEISVSIYAASQSMYVVGVDLFCTLTDDGLRKWQQQTFDAIIRAYQTQLADYEDKLAALDIQKGIQIFGRNPLENRRIERDELKKLAVIIMTDDTDPSLNGFTSSQEPTLNVDRACAAGQRIRFFENAFEWNNMTYVFYPYFWGRKGRWQSAIQLSDPDPDFAAFLKAGAARVQVPVRPGFEKAISYYLQTGVIWNGNDPPLMDDDLYVPIIDEITESLGAPEPVTPYPADSEPWEVHVPTSLVLVQDLEEIPGIVDTLTGNATQIAGPSD